MGEKHITVLTLSHLSRVNSLPECLIYKHRHISITMHLSLNFYMNWLTKRNRKPMPETLKFPSDIQMQTRGQKTKNQFINLPNRAWSCSTVFLHTAFDWRREGFVMFTTLCCCLFWWWGSRLLLGVVSFGFLSSPGLSQAIGDLTRSTLTMWWSEVPLEEKTE